MRTENGDGTRRDFGKFLDKARALGLKVFDDVPIVHDLVAHVDRRSVYLERPFHDIDGTHHACAVAARLRQYDLHGLRPISTPRARSWQAAAPVGLQNGHDWYGIMTDLTPSGRYYS